MCAPDQTIAAVRSDVVDAILPDRASLMTCMVDKDEEFEFISMDNRQSHDLLHAAVNAAIDEIAADASLNTLVQWFGDGVSLLV